MKKKLFSVIIFEMFLLLSLIFILPDWENLQITFLSVGEGDAIYGQYQNFDFLIDAGPNNLVLSEYGKVKDFFDNKVDFLLITHPHDDHAVGALEFLKREHVGMVFLPRTNKSSALFEKIKNICREENIAVYEIYKNETFNFGNLKLQIWPSNNLASNDTNDSSIVTKISFGTEDFLLTGDISEKMEKYFLQNGYDLNAEVLKIAHHGSHYSSDLEFLKMVNPEVAVITVGKNSFGHPSNLILNRLQSLKIKLRRTDLELNPAFETDGSTLIFK
ncbi:MAG: MBL fold metallo-hydrolase [Patescibacteria group bacterium]